MKICQSCEEKTEDKLTEVWNPFWILARSGVIKVCPLCLRSYVKHFPQILQGVDATDLFAARICWLSYDSDLTNIEKALNAGKILVGSIEQLKTLGCKIVLRMQNEIWLVGRYSAVSFSFENARVIELLKKLTGLELGEKTDATQ